MTQPPRATPDNRAIRYWCRDCPEVFYDSDSSNTHHDKTKHRQTWRPSFAYQPPKISEETK